MPRPRTVYRGKRKYSWIITLAAMLLVLLIVLAVWLFYYLQRYIVYDKDGLRLDLSAQREEILHPGTLDSQPTEKPDFTPIDVEIVVEEKDYSEVVTTAGTDLQPLRAVYVPAAEVTESTLKYYSGSTGDFNALVLELKEADGNLRWHSSVPAADSFAVNGTLELAESVAALKEKGIYLVAQLGSLADGNMARRNAPISLKEAASGGTYTDRDGSAYLDPYSAGARDYLKSLMSELKAMGFDEVLFSGFVCPDSDGVTFSLAMTQKPDAASALSALGLWLRSEADAMGLKLSVRMESKALRSEEVLMGQDAALLFRIFDRVVAETDFDHLSGDLAALDAALGTDDENRAVLITEDFAPERESYIVK